MRPSGRDRPAVSERSSLARSRVVDGWHVERPHRPIPVRGLRSARSHGIRHRSCSVRRRFGACLRRRSGRKRLPARPSPRADSRRENKHWRWCRRQRRQCGACVEDEELLVRVEIVLVPINRQGVVTLTAIWPACGRRRRRLCNGRHLPPLSHRVAAELAECSAGDQMALDVEEVVDGRMDGEEPLRGRGRFEPLHLSLSSSHRLM